MVHVTMKALKNEIVANSCTGKYKQTTELSTQFAYAYNVI